MKTLVAMAAAMLGFSAMVTGCGAPAQQPSPTAAAAAPTKAAAATTAPATAPATSATTTASTPVATAAPTKPAAASTTAAAATSVPTIAVAAPNTAPAASAATPSLNDLMAKAKANAEYSYEFKVTESGQTVAGKAFAKSSKLRQEMVVDGQNGVILIDTSAKTALMLMPEEKMAIKVDYSKFAAAYRRPDSASTLDAAAKVSGTETVDGKPAVVVETSVNTEQSKIWYWTERGLPLKVESTGPLGKATTLFTNYQFTTQPDSLFALPPGVQVIDVPTGMPAGNIGVPGGVPGLPGNIPGVPTK